MSLAVQRALSRELRELAERANAIDGYVFDSWAVVWSWSRRPHAGRRQALFEQIKALLGALDKPLHRGGELRGNFDLPRPAYCHTFATVYVLMLWTSEATNQLVMRRAIREALPRIESLTLSLSPISGPGGARAAAAMKPEPRS